MSAFDYLTVLVSIVLGLAIANVLSRLAAVITARERVDFYWPPIAWAVWLFFVAAQHWCACRSWRTWRPAGVADRSFMACLPRLHSLVPLLTIEARARPARRAHGRRQAGDVRRVKRE